MNQLRIKKLISTEVPARIVLDCMSDIVLVISKDWTRLDHLNPRTRDLVGCPANLQGGMPNWIQSIVAAKSRPAVEQLISQINSNLQPQDVPTIELRSIVGSNVPIKLHSLLISEDHWFLFATSDADKSTVEEVLRQTQARFRSIVDGLSINLVLKDTDGRVVYANQRFLDFNNWKLEGVLGKTDSQLFTGDLATKFSQDDQLVLESGRVLHHFEQNRKADGTVYWAEVIKGPLLDADGNIAGVQVLFWDATDRKQTEQALQEERHLLHTLLNNIPDSIYFKDLESRFTRVSRSMIEKFGWADSQALVGQTDADVFSSEHSSQARSDEVEIMRSQTAMIGVVERETWPDREDTWSSTTKLPLRDPEGNVVGTFGISRDVTKLVEAENQLRVARDSADQANRAKSEFLANMSHEIRTPMNGIIGMTELLSHTRLNDAQRSFVSMIESSAQSLLRIINDILDFSKIEAGKLDLEEVPFDLRACVSHATKSLATRAAQNGTELVLRLSREIPDRMIGDEIRLRQILVNLISNAVKFTHGGEITVRVSVADGPPAAENYSLHFSVADTGIGIPAEKQSKIFEAFSQADVSTTRQYGGTGLGLSIASQLVQMMGGRIWLESEVGVGSVFHFTGQFAPAVRMSDDESEDLSRLQHLPVLIVDDNATSRKLLAQSLARCGLMTRETDSSEEAQRIFELYLRETPGPIVLLVDQIMPSVDAFQLISSLQNQLGDRRLITMLLTTAAHPITEQQMERFHIEGLLQKPTLAQEVCQFINLRLNLHTAPAVTASTLERDVTSSIKLRVLLAEDGAVNRAVFMGLLSEQGHEVTCVEDGEAAIEAWQDFDFDAIFMDVQMPILDGLEATQRIRQLESDGEHIPIIAITAGAMAEDEQRCLQAGMDDYLSKPIEIKQLASVLNTLVLHVQGRTDEWSDSSELPETTQIETSGPKSLNIDAPLSKVKCTPTQQRELVKTLRAETVQRIDEISRAFESQDDKLLVRASHSLKSAAALFEAKQVVEVSSAIENAARAGDTQSAQSHYDQLKQATAVMLAQIDQWLKMN